MVVTDIIVPVETAGTTIEQKGESIVKVLHNDVINAASGYTQAVKSVFTGAENTIEGVGKSFSFPLLIIGAAVGGLFLINTMKN